METAIISGKGGTGKSSISAAFATLSERVVVADCDVDAANLYLIFRPDVEEEQPFIGGQGAVIDQNICTNCGICVPYCRFDALLFRDHEVVVSEVACDGCALCVYVCPVNAITMENHADSRLISGSFRNGRMVYGRLAPGEENSGKLVNLVREKARQSAKNSGIHHIIIDGPPGTGCPVISSVSGVDRVVIVTEPTLSGFHDLKRAIELVNGFHIKLWIIINKCDLDPLYTQKIETYCQEVGVSMAGKIPFDPRVVEAMVQCKSIVEYAPDSPVSVAIKSAWYTINKVDIPQENSRKQRTDNIKNKEK